MQQCMDLHLDRFTGSRVGRRLRSMPQSTCPTNTSNRTTCLSNLTQDPSLLRSLTRGTPPPCSKLAISIGSINLRVTEEEARQRFEALKLQQANLENQLATASRIANEEAREASNRKLAADERLRQTEVRLITCTTKGLQTSVKSLINRSDKRMLPLTRRKRWQSYKARTLLMR